MKTKNIKDAVFERVNSMEKENKHPDIDRLERVCKTLKSLEDIYYHMDSDEYERMKKYIYSRFGISLQLKDPTKKELP